MKNINERCPLSGDCERKKCEHINRELECDYYRWNATPENQIDDQEALRESDFDEDVQFCESRSIEMLPLEEIFPHPDNPRKEIGDVSELAESIKANGILQNLTVIPGHYMTESEYVNMAKAEGAKAGAARASYDPHEWFEPDGYTVIIGHRRLAAAKLAGLSEVPCSIVDMGKAEQLSTMLTENMQRTDLTIYEQAKGFQMMLDLGKTVEDVASMSGFSKTTVRSRAKLSSLDEKEFKKACSRGATLFDFAELDKIDSDEDKQYCLKHIGTQNFKNTLKTILDKQKLKGRMVEWLEVIKTFATERTGSKDELKYVCNFSYYNMSKEVEIPEDATEVNYYYFVCDREIDLYKERDKDKEAQEEADRAERRARENAEREKYESVSDRHYELRKAFVKELTNANVKQRMEPVAEFLASVIQSADNSGYYSIRPSLDVELLRECMRIPESIAADEDDDEEETSRFFGDTELISSVSALSEKLVFCLAYCAMERKSAGYYTHEWNRETQKYEYLHKENDRLDLLYSVLCNLGYEMSDEEIAMQSGTHELFSSHNE